MQSQGNTLLTMDCNGKAEPWRYGNPPVPSRRFAISKLEHAVNLFTAILTSGGDIQIFGLSREPNGQLYGISPKEEREIL